jgi:hypothetical protein
MCRHGGTRYQRWPPCRDLLPQFVLLGLGFVVFDVVPHLLLGWVRRAEHQNLAQSILVSVKNPTVIALTILWMAGVGRMLMRAGLDAQQAHRLADPPRSGRQPRPL